MKLVAHRNTAPNPAPMKTTEYNLSSVREVDVRSTVVENPMLWQRPHNYGSETHANTTLIPRDQQALLGQEGNSRDDKAV